MTRSEQAHIVLTQMLRTYSLYIVIQQKLLSPDIKPHGNGKCHVETDATRRAESSRIPQFISHKLQLVAVYVFGPLSSLNTNKRDVESDVQSVYVQLQ